MKKGIYISILVLLFCQTKVFAQSPIGELRVFEILKSKDTLVLNKKLGTWWGGALFGLNYTNSFLDINLPRNYNPEIPQSMKDSIIPLTPTWGNWTYHLGAKFEWNPGGSFWGGGLDLFFIDQRITDNKYLTNGDKIAYISTLDVDYITLSPYIRYNYKTINLGSNQWDIYFNGGLDFETKLQNVLEYKKTFESSEQIDWERIIAEQPLAFRLGINLGIGAEWFSADVNKRLRMKVNPYMNLHLGSTVFNDFNSSLNQVYLRVGVALKISPDIIHYDTLKWNEEVVTPQNLQARRDKGFNSPSIALNEQWPDHIEKPRLLNPPKEKEPQFGLTIPEDKKPKPERREYAFDKPKEFSYQNYEQTALSNKMKEELDLISEYLIQNPKVMIKITGHTDQNGKDLNERLAKSKKRYELAVNYLIKKGVKKDRIRFEAKGNLVPKHRNVRDNRIEIEKI